MFCLNCWPLEYTSCSGLYQVVLVIILAMDFWTTKNVSGNNPLALFSSKCV